MKTGSGKGCEEEVGVWVGGKSARDGGIGCGGGEGKGPQ